MDSIRFQHRLGQQLRARRVQLGRTQAEVADHLGLTRSSVSNIEAGNQALSLITFMELAHFLDLRPGALLEVVATVDPDDFLDVPNLPAKYHGIINSLVHSSRFGSD